MFFAFSRRLIHFVALDTGFEVNVIHQVALLLVSSGPAPITHNHYAVFDSITSGLSVWGRG